MWTTVADFCDLPMPPSVNHAYINLPRGGRVPSAHLKAFYKEMDAWCLGYLREITHTRLKVASRYLRLEFVYFVPRKKLFSKIGVPKSWDVSNRIKAIEDALCRLLDVDDKWVWLITAAKCEVDDDDPERVSVEISVGEL
jgi:Holliday junction resolvase RusA-like endonuclease